MNHKLKLKSYQAGQTVVKQGKEVQLCVGRRGLFGGRCKVLYEVHVEARKKSVCCSSHVNAATNQKYTASVVLKSKGRVLQVTDVYFVVSGEIHATVDLELMEIYPGSTKKRDEKRNKKADLSDVSGSVGKQLHTQGNHYEGSSFSSETVFAVSPHHVQAHPAYSSMNGIACLPAFCSI